MPALKLGARMAASEYFSYADVDHRQIRDTDRHVLEAHKLLQSLQIAAVLQNVDRKTVTEYLRCHA